MSDKIQTKAIAGEILPESKITSLDATETAKNSLTYAQKIHNSIRSMLNESGEPSAAFKTLVADYLKAIIPNLPSGKYLKQEIIGAPSDEYVTSFVKAFFATEESIPIGLGAEYTLINNMSVANFDPSKFVPVVVGQPETKTYTSAITIPAPGSNTPEVTMSYQSWKFIPFFLSGKMDEYLAQIKATQDNTLQMRESIDAINFLKIAYAEALTLGTPSGSPDGYVITNNKVDPTLKVVTSNAGSIFDALRDIRSVMYSMVNHNKVFSRNPTFGGYSSSRMQDLRIIAPVEVINNIRSIGVPLLKQENLFEFADLNSWYAAPKTAQNPTTGEIVQFNFFGANANDIYIVDIAHLKKVYNWATRDFSYFANNATEQMWNRKNYVYGILDWAQSCVFRCPALNANFSLPTKTVAA
jgi:hypothetical protein